MDDDFRKAALDYHRLPRPGKLSVEPTKRMATQRDLALAYSPGVAAACEEIAKDPDKAWDYTARGNMVVEGLGMLLHQAVRGFSLWFGVTPTVTPELYDLVARDIDPEWRR